MKDWKLKIKKKITSPFQPPPPPVDPVSPLKDIFFSPKMSPPPIIGDDEDLSDQEMVSNSYLQIVIWSLIEGLKPNSLKFDEIVGILLGRK